MPAALLREIPRDARRVVVRGTSGSGKTTLARAIAEALGLPSVELDGVFHQEHWTPLPDDQFEARVRDLADGDEWVICGNYRIAKPILLGRADTAVLYDLTRATVMRRVIRRTIVRAARREVLWNGNREPWRNFVRLDPHQSIIAWTWTQHDRYHRELVELLANPPRDDLRFVHLASLDDERHLYRDLATCRAGREHDDAEFGALG